MNSRVTVTGFQRLVWFFLFLSWTAVAVSRLCGGRPAPVCCPATHSPRDPATGGLISTSESERECERVREIQSEREERQEQESERGRE